MTDSPSNTYDNDASRDPLEGDPDGRRIAQKRVLQLGEAGDVAHALKALLTRANHPTKTINYLVSEIVSAERSQLQKAQGRIPPRRRYKRQTGQPLHDGRPTNHIFIDECGTSHLEPNPTGKLFALGGVSMPSESVERYSKQIDAIKRDFFGDTIITLHEPQMRRRTGPFAFTGNASKQLAFDSAIEKLLDDIDFDVFGVGVRKDGFASEFVKTSIDPYLPTDVYALSIMLLMERYVDFLANCEIPTLGKVHFESIGPKEDAIHQMEFARLLLDGSQWVSDSAFRNWVETGITFTIKQGTHPLEIADMFTRDLFEWVNGGCVGNPKRWEIFSSKIYGRDDGQRGKFGVKVFPDLDIREQVMAHRARCGFGSRH